MKLRTLRLPAIVLAAALPASAAEQSFTIAEP